MKRDGQVRYPRPPQQLRTNIEILGSWLTGTTHAKEAGGNRALIFIAHDEYSGNNLNLSSVTYGGQSMTKIIEINASTGTGYRNYVAAYILNEAGVAAATHRHICPQHGAYTPESASYASVFLQTSTRRLLSGQWTVTGQQAALQTRSRPIRLPQHAAIWLFSVLLAATSAHIH